MKHLFTIIALTSVLAITAAAQSEISRPKAGEVQISLITGSTYSLYSQANGFDYLMPYSNGIQNESSIGFGDTPMGYLDLSSLNSNSIINSVGLRLKVFVHERWDVNILFGMNINLQPKKDFIEGDYTIPNLPIPSYDYIIGRTHHAFYTQLGTNFYFLPKNARILPYVGVVGGFQFARVETFLPYTGLETEDDPIELYTPSYQAGQAWAIQAGIVAGIDFTLLEGLIFGIEVAPAMYQMSVMQVNPTGAQLYQAVNHDIKLLTMPRLKIGFRF